MEFCHRYRESRRRAVLPEALSKLNQDIYPWGKNWPPPNNSGNYWDAKINELSAKASFQATYADGFNSRSPVMSFPANTLGLYDLEGNVLEWCEDWYNEQRERKVHRGPSFMTGMLGMKDFRSSHRRNDPPENREDRFAEFGFRCVIELPLASASASPPAVAPPAVPATSAPEPGPELRWVDSSGRVIMARFGGINGENVMLVRADGSRLPYPMTRLSSASQQLARDLAAGTSPAQQGIAGKSFDAITLDDIVKSQDLLKSDRIEASDDRVLAVGTILIYQTCEGRFGKARVEAPAPRKGDYTLTLSWCTFEQDNKVRSSGKNLVIKSLFAVDLDAGKLAKTNDGADIHWGLQSVDSPYLARSQKPALLAILPSSTSAKP